MLEVSEGVILSDFENLTCSEIYILKMMAFHKTLISRVTQTWVVSPIGPRSNFPCGVYRQESRRGRKAQQEMRMWWISGKLAGQTSIMQVGNLGFDHWTMEFVLINLAGINRNKQRQASMTLSKFTRTHKVIGRYFWIKKEKRKKKKSRISARFINISLLCLIFKAF